jgi:dTMP kinase
MRSKNVIALEGIDGGGKSTLAHSIEQYLSDQKKSSVVITSQCLADLEDVVHLQKLLSLPRIHPLAISLFRCAEMAQRWRGIATPALETKDVVIFDRYNLTPLVRDVLRGVPEKYVKNIYSFLPPPNLLIYLDVNPQTALNRKLEAGIPLGKWESGADLMPSIPIQQAFLNFQTRCRERYKEILPKNTIVVDANGDANSVWHTVVPRIGELIGLTP